MYTGHVNSVGVQDDGFASVSAQPQSPVGTWRLARPSCTSAKSTPTTLARVASCRAMGTPAPQPASRTRARGGSRTTRSFSNATSGESQRRDERYAPAMRLYDSRTCVLGSMILESSSRSVISKYTELEFGHRIG